MSYFINIVVLFLIIILVYLIIYQKKKVVVKKSSSMKKDEILQDYKQQMIQLLKENENNPEKLKIEKMNFIKNMNAQLNKNIFFDANEIKKIIYELTLM